MNQIAKEICTCTDTKCPNHPANHEEGCALCIRKNLALREIPSCFFRLAAGDISGREDFSFEGFAELIKERQTGE